VLVIVGQPENAGRLTELGNSIYVNNIKKYVFNIRKYKGFGMVVAEL
jgi:hypothetical protein